MQATKTAAKEIGREMVHILVVDDEKSMCELLEITFRKEGHRVETANNVDAAKRSSKARSSTLSYRISACLAAAASIFCDSPRKSRRIRFSCS